MKILTRGILKYVRKGFTVGEKFGAHPFRWSPSKDLLELTTSRKQYALWYMNVLLAFVYAGFVIGRYVQMVLSKEFKLEMAVYMQFMILVWVLTCVYQMSVALARQDLPICIRSILEWLQYFEDVYFVEAANIPKIIFYIPHLLKFFFYSFIGNCVLFSLNALARPNSPDMIASIFNSEPDDDLLYLLIWLSCTLVQVHIVFNCCVFAGLTFSFTALGLIFPLLVVLHDIEEPTSKLSQSVDLNGSYNINIHRHLKLLLTCFNQAFCIFLPGLQFIFVILATFCLYGATQFKGPLAGFLGFVGFDCTLFLCLLFSLLAEFHSRSTKSLRTMRRLLCRIDDKRRRAWYGRVVKSMPCLHIQIGSWYYVDKFLVFTLFKIIFDSSINFILMKGRSYTS